MTRITTATRIAVVRLSAALKTPAGMPDRAMISDSACAEPGTISAGLNTTLLPMDFTYPISTSFAKAVAPFDIFWLEEPFLPDEYEAYAELARRHRHGIRYIDPTIDDDE